MKETMVKNESSYLLLRHDTGKIAQKQVRVAMWSVLRKHSQLVCIFILLAECFWKVST